jgi:hypothetical protein
MLEKIERWEKSNEMKDGDVVRFGFEQLKIPIYRKDFRVLIETN